MKNFILQHINALSLSRNFCKIYSQIYSDLPDVFCISETWSNDHKDNNNIDGYCLIHRNRICNKRGGGVGIYVKNILKF